MDETGMIVYADGGCHGNGTSEAQMYGSYRVFANDGRELAKHELTGLGHGTNNRAEYLTLLDVLNWCVSQPKPIVVYMDSQLVVNQVNGEWKVKDATLQGMRDKAAWLLNLCGASLRWVRRDVIMEKLGH